MDDQRIDREGGVAPRSDDAKFERTDLIVPIIIGGLLAPDIGDGVLRLLGIEATDGAIFRARIIAALVAGVVTFLVWMRLKRWRSLRHPRKN